MASKYTAQQIYALGQFINANASEFPNYHIGNQIRHLEFNSQRNLTDASEQYFQKFLHTTVEKAMGEAAAVMARQSQPQKPTHAPPTSDNIDQKTGTVKIIDLSESKVSENPRTAVFVDCSICKKEFAVPAARANEPAFCSRACFDKASAKQNSALAELQKFLTEVGKSYHDCDFNVAAMTEYLRTHTKTITSENLFDAYISLRNNGKLLMPMSAEAMHALSPDEFQKRIAIDPTCGGAIDAANAAAKPQETLAWSSNKQRFGQTFERQGASSKAGS